MSHLKTDRPDTSLQQKWEDLREGYRAYFPAGVEISTQDDEFKIATSDAGLCAGAYCKQDMRQLHFSNANVSTDYAGHAYGMMSYALFAALAIQTGRMEMSMFCSGTAGAYNWLKAGATLDPGQGDIGWQLLSRMLADHLKEMQPYIPSGEMHDWYADKIGLKNQTQDLWDMLDRSDHIDHWRYKTLSFALFSMIPIPAKHDLACPVARGRLVARLQDKAPNFAAQITPIFK